MKSSRNMSHSVSEKGARGTKLITDTGLDNSSMHKGSTEQLKNSGMGGGRDSIAHSIKDGKVASCG